jgi:hypothetical protein
MYVVIENTPGYLPEDDDPGTFEDIESAKEYLAERVESYVEHLREAEIWTDVHWVSWADDKESCHVSSSLPHDLGRNFEIAITELVTPTA